MIKLTIFVIDLWSLSFVILAWLTKKKKKMSEILLTHLVQYFLIFPLFSNKNNIKKFPKKTKYIKKNSHTRHRCQNTESHALTKRQLHGYIPLRQLDDTKKNKTLCKLKNQNLEKSEKHKPSNSSKKFAQKRNQEWKSHRKYC